MRHLLPVTPLRNASFYPEIKHLVSSKLTDSATVLQACLIPSHAVYFSALKMEVAWFSEVLVSVYQTALGHIPEQHGLDLLQCF